MKLEKETAQQEKNNQKLIKQKEEDGQVKMKASSNIQLQSFKVSYKLNLIAEEGAYMLIVDSKMGIS